MLLCAVFGVVQAQQVSLDFSTNDWELPEGSANKLTESKSFTNSAGYTVTLQAADGYYFNTQGYLMLGKAGSTLTLPAFNFKVSKIAVVGNSGASASVKQNIFVGEEAVSTETEGAKGTNEYVIASDKRAVGTIYTLKVLSAHNTQITQIKIYKEGDEGLSAPNLSFGSTTSFTVELGKEFTAPELTYAEGFDGTVTYASDNTEAVEVNANTGAVTIKAVGTAKITASSAATTKFEAGEASYTIKVVEPQGSHEVEDGTFDFTGTTDYGSGLEPSAEDITEDHTWTAGNVTLVTSGKYRWWYNASGNTLRFYNNEVDDVQTSRMTISVPSGYEITKIEITGGRQFKSDDDKYDASKGEWSGNAQSVVLRYAASSGNVAVKTVTVTYSKKGSAIYTSSIYKKVTSTDGLTSGTYLIVYDEGSIAFNGSLETLDAAGNTIEVVINNNEIKGSETIDAATFTIDINEEGSTIKSASGYYIGRQDDSNGLLSSTETKYANTLTIDNDGNANILSSGGAYLRYNATSGQERFRYFRSTTYTSQKAIQLYKLVSQEAEPVELTIGTIGYSTLYYSNKALVVPEGVVAKTFKLNDAGTDVVVSTLYEKDEVIPADCGVVIEAIDKGKEQDFTFDVAQTEATPDPDNLLLGLDEGGQTVGPDGDTEGYIFYMLSTKNGNVGFYWKHGGAPFETNAHKAYLAIPKESGVNISSFVFDDLNGITAITNNSTEGAEDVYTLSGMRMDSKQLPKGIYIVNGKKMVIK